MTNALPAADRPEPGDQASPGDWQELRGELRSLLQQVDLRPAQETGVGQVSHTAPADAKADDRRHLDALRSVNRAVARLSDREDVADVDPRAERNLVRAAIKEIRDRQPRTIEDTVSRMQPQTPFASLATAIAAANDRLGQIEVRLNEQRGTAANVAAISGQIAEITHVVELLAGAVGNREETDRLEAQIGALRELIVKSDKTDLTGVTARLDTLSETIASLAGAQARHLDSFGELVDAQARQTSRIEELARTGGRTDLDDLSRRLDDVSATVDRLADLQIRQVQQLARDAKEAPQRAEALTTAMQAVEAAVRSIYDRIDEVEKSRALPSAELEALTQTVSSFTTALGEDRRPDALLALIETMDQKLDGVAENGATIAALRSEIGALKSAFIEALEPRFKSIEAQIGALDARLTERDRPSDAALAQIEAQVRQLVARMDQTGEQLSSLARLYAEAAETQVAPDLDALAEQVAARTSEALTQIAPQAALAELSEAGLASLEARVSKLIQESGHANESDVVRDGILKVDQRLTRLEASLMERVTRHSPRIAPENQADSAAAAPASLPTQSQVQVQPYPEPSSAADAMVSRLAPAIGPRPDVMPNDPVADAPLVDKPFGDPEHPAITSRPVTLDTASHDDFGLDIVDIGQNGQEPEDLLPPRPVSSLEQDLALFENAGAHEPENPFETAPPSRSAFIAAHRAAQRATIAHRSGFGGVSADSIIGRALARFQSAEAEADSRIVATPEPAPEPVAPPKKLSRKQRKALARLEVEHYESASATDEHATPDEQDAAIELAGEPLPGASMPRESFLSRNRRPILLGASLVAIAALTVNLVAQRIGEEGDVTPAGTDLASTAAPETAASTTPQTAVAAMANGGASGAPKPLPAQPRVIPLTDTLATGSISTTPAMGFTKPTGATAMPPALEAATTTAQAAAPVAPSADAAMPVPAGDSTEIAALPDSAAPMVASPVKVEMPPAGIGPDALRQAAADGDARAQFEVAAIFTEGRAVPTDLKAAAVWYERSAAQGFAPSQYRLASLYETGKGVAKDLELARLWYQRAAEAGNRMSMHNLAALYAGGQLGKQDFPSAAEWFEQAAMRGMTDSQFNLGMLYARGLGVPQDLETSYKWFSLAAQSGDKDAIKARDDVARSLDAAAVTRLQGEVAQWKPVPIDLAANFAPIGTWSKDFDPGEPITDKTVVTRVQLALERLGFDVGTPDGKAGPKTAVAIKAFEKATGMTEVGAINPRLLAVLGSQPV